MKSNMNPGKLTFGFLCHHRNRALTGRTRAAELQRQGIHFRITDYPDTMNGEKIC
jgi:phage head maturation protease